MERPSWEQYFGQLTQLTSMRSPCKRLQVGCILVSENRIVAQGYNGYLPGTTHEQKLRDGHEMATVHAEQNAIADCAKRGVSSNNTTAYITHYPCINCCKLLLASGVSNICYKSDYKNDPIVGELLKEAGVSAKKI